MEKIVVIDDEEEIREMVASMLTTTGYECQQASSGKEALALLDSGAHFELVLCDLLMPEVDGIGLLEQIQKRSPGTPMVMLTAIRDISVALLAIRRGAYDYVIKPFDREQLLATVRRALESHRLKGENRAYQTRPEAVADITDVEDMTLEAFGDRLAMKDAETAAHSRRVTAFSIAIARQMGIPPDSREMRVLARGAFLHDIGKMAIPYSILRKPERLEPHEIEIMREHCVHSYRMLDRIPFLQEARELVYAHHEKYDGSGYPRGLKGNAIPFGARIVAVANTLDSILSDLQYRPAQTIEAARKEIEAWSGSQFDPAIAKVFLSMSTNIWEDLRRQINAQARLQFNKTSSWVQ